MFDSFLTELLALLDDKFPFLCTLVDCCDVKLLLLDR